MSGPTSRRAACGISRPIQPMIPLTATAAAVIKVAAATTMVRSLRVSTPSARASSSGRASRFMRQRSSSIGARPSSAITEPSRVPMTTPVRTRASSGSWPRSREPMKYTMPTAASPPANANSWMKSTFSERKMPSTAPSAAPVDTPRMSGDTSGLRNIPW